jgi:hypothetical protein
MAKYDTRGFVRAWPFVRVDILDNGLGNRRFETIHVEGREEPIKLAASLHPDAGPKPGDMVVDFLDRIFWLPKAEFDDYLEPAE